MYEPYLIFTRHTRPGLQTLAPQTVLPKGKQRSCRHAWLQQVPPQACSPVLQHSTSLAHCIGCVHTLP